MKRYKRLEMPMLSSKAYFTTLFLTFLSVWPDKCLMQDYPPREFSTEPNTQNPIPELSLKIVLCRASSSPSAQYRWMKDGTYITEYNALDYSYRMMSVNRTDAGIYRCVAKNYLGAIRSKGAKIVIAYIDNFESHTNQTVNVLSGDGVVINLPSINSVPDPAVSWYASGVEMAPEAQRHQITLEKNLVLLSTSIHSDNGKIYKAEALNGINGVSKTTKDFALRVGDTGEGVTKPPALLVGPKNTTAKTGDRDTKLECIYNARPLSGLQTKWYKKGSQRTEIVANNKYIFNTVYKRVLTIKDPDLSDAGQYECEAVLVSNGQSSTKTSDAYLTVNEAPLITSQIQSQYLRDFGQSIQVDCQATGNPSPTITWYFNAQPVSSVANNRLSVTQGGSLKIENLELSDSGVYQCFASNAAGETKVSAWIKVDQSPPMFISTPLNLTLVEGADARFPCKVSGAPKPVIIWKKKLDNIESEVTTGGRYQISPTTNELLIITTEPSDSALFSCNASNSQGSIYAEATLNVYQRTQITQPPLAITEVEKGSVASLQCGVSHDVNVNITWKWYKGQVELNPSDRITIEQDGTLTILSVYSSDSGVYKCQVLSAGGNDERSTNLKVIELPFMPVITNIAVPPTALKSANISFTPGPNGNTPIERFIFQKRMVTYYPDKGVTMGEDEGWETYPQDVAPNVRFFVMPNLRPARYFQFRLKSVNKVGVGPASHAKPNTPLLMPEQPPEAAPRGFYGSPRSNSSIMLNWQAPPSDTWNGDLTGYKVKYRLKGYTSPFLERSTNPWPSTSFELTGLIVFTEYEIKIAAYNNEGVGLYSDSINVRTREGVPGVPPTDVNVSSVNSTAIKIVWLPPDASKINGVNLGYIILAKGPGNIEERLTVPPDPTDPYNFQQAFMYNLKKFTDYTITVTCYTGQGPGPASTPIHIKTEEDVPDEVVHLSFTDIFDTSVKVIWQHPVEINGILTGYTLLWEKKNQNKTRKDINLSNTTLTYTVRDLDPTTKYTIYIYGKTSKGAGKNSSADFESGVPPERPGAPYNLGISDIQARSTLLQFLLGYDGKTSITLWRIHGQIDNNDTWVPIYEISDPDARTILVPNLRPFTMYRLRITAVNIVGPGNYSAPSRQFQTAQAPPNVPPDNVTVRAINSTALRISWAPLSQLNWNGYPRGYRMIYKRKDEVNTHEVVLDTDSESYTLAKLEEWMEYEVKMNAYNDVGSSPFSPISTERTRDAKPTTDSVRWNLTSAAERHDVSCLSDSISVFIPSDLLSHYQTTWRDPHCQVQDNGTHYVSTISHTSCGTTVIFTKDEVIFENELILHKSGSPSNQTSNGSIDFGSSDSEVIPVQCIYPRRQNISTLYRPAQSTVRFYEKRYGHMDVQLEQYKSGMFVTPLPVRSFPNEVEINKDMYFILHAMHVNSTDVAVKVDSCVATPSNIPADGRIYQLLDQGCPASPAVKVYPSAFDEVRFSVRAFEFRTSPGGIVYIHCQVSVCSPTSPQCRVGCAHRHRREVSTEDGGSHLVSGGPYLLVADKGGLQVSTVVAGVCASVAVVATVIAIVGWRRKSSASTSSSKL